MRVLLCIIFILFFFNNTFSHDISITVVADPWPPYIEDSDPASGFTLEILQEAFKTQGYDIEYINIPWARAEFEVKEGRYDVLPNVWFSNARSADLLYSKSYAVNNIMFITLKNDDFIYSGIDSLSDKKVGVLRSYAYSEEFTNSSNFIKVEVNTLLASIKMLLQGRIDLTLEDEVVAKNIIKNNEPELLDKLRFSSVPLISNSLYITSSYKNPRHKKIIDAFNKGLSEIKINGIYDKIAIKYNLY